MEINMERLLNDFAIITGFTKTPGNGCTRFSYSKEDRQARDYLIAQMHLLGLAVKVDAIGNIRATYGKGKEGPAIMIGSHIDTVENGGKYDGLAGVLAALEVIRVLKEDNAKISRPVEMIIFAEEEGSNFGVTMLGSKVLTGRYQLEELKSLKDGEGNSAYTLAKNFGLEIDEIKRDMLKPDEVDTMIELHIEQGVVLETQNKSLGIVQAIAGMKTVKVTLEGDSNHAGTTPMNLRSDPLVGASIVISQIQKAAKENALPTTVATVGKITCQPNMPNVIPQKVEFFVDIRDVEAEGIAMISEELALCVSTVSAEHSLKSNIDLIGVSESVELSSRIVGLIKDIAEEKSHNYMEMNSGAVHDSAMMAGVAEVGMIFIPSMGGKSHCPEEYTSEEDIKAGCELLLDVVRVLASEKDKAKLIS